eukprot:COSAG06_NODE_2333_length_7059_cov_109.820402_3_plen_70_part_00
MRLESMFTVRLNASLLVYGDVNAMHFGFVIPSSCPLYIRVSTFLHNTHIIAQVRVPVCPTTSNHVREQL